MELDVRLNLGKLARCPMSSKFDYTLDNATDRIHLVGQLKVILETIIYLQSEQLKVQKQIDKLKAKQ